MTDPLFVSRPDGPPPALGASGCPPVADLILYALGQAPPEDRQRVERHLRQGDCRHCRGWLEQAARLQAETASESRTRAKSFVHFRALPSSRARAVSGPAPESTHRQQEALRDLEQRLCRLAEDEQGPEATEV
jgi:anti-sigma factor RsiW